MEYILLLTACINPDGMPFTCLDVEHKVRYKKNIPDSEAEQLAAELSSCADQIAAMDNKMEEIRRRIAEAEEREAENSPAKQPQTIGGVMLKKRLESGRFPFKK